jgi:hypothetical protein
MPHKFLTDVGVKFIKEYSQNWQKKVTYCPDERLNIYKMHQQICDNTFYDNIFNHKVFCVKCPYLPIKFVRFESCTYNNELIIIEANTTIKQFLYRIYEFYHSDLPIPLKEFLSCNYKNPLYYKRDSKKFLNAVTYADLMIGRCTILYMSYEQNHGMINIYFDMIQS